MKFGPGWIFLLPAILAAQSPRLTTWTLEQGRWVPGPGATAAPLAVGSLQKPFVAKAWAAAHPAAAPPRYRCGSASACWLPSGHGDLGLVRALAVSCNAYFRALAKDTPPQILESTFHAEGFSSLPLSPDLAIGLVGPEGAPTIAPRDLLEAYGRLAREPWPVGEPVRAQVLAGLREAALKGTAGALGQRGWWAKTGTVPSPDVDPTRTTGLLVATDDAGWAILARLEPGTGRQAAAALAPALARWRPWQAARTASAAVVPPPPKREPPAAASAGMPSVRVRILDLLGAQQLEVRNLGAAPIPAVRGYLGPGAARSLRAGDRIGPGLLELRDPATGLARRLEGSLVCGRTSKGGVSLTATVAVREYVSGVLAAELPHAAPARRIELGAAVLRFLAQGPRHSGAEVCDSTHCAWFLGRGPRVAWVTPRRAVHPQEEAVDTVDALNGLPDADWVAVGAAAARPGPALWTAHCGGAPLSPHAVWGQGDTTIQACARHINGPARPWIRIWKAADLAKAFGAAVRGLRVDTDAGIWRLRVESDRAAWSLGYDQAHRQLAVALGWDALPSPADAIEAVPGGFRATGVGWGHRVGLCLGE
ncbi:MAG: hypothetical protein IPQ13_09905 [Holophagaceae bacterium]|nr:hypothetical protein [Holophagaceae bacterium]